MEDYRQRGGGERGKKGRLPVDFAAQHRTQDDHEEHIDRGLLPQQPAVPPTDNGNSEDKQGDGPGRHVEKTQVARLDMPPSTRSFRK
jgi:hypothetical protein